MERSCRAAALPWCTADNVYYVRYGKVVPQDETNGCRRCPTCGSGVTVVTDPLASGGSQPQAIGEKERSRSSPSLSDGSVGDMASGDGPTSVVLEVPPLSDIPDQSTTLDAFYRELLHELGEFARRPSATAIGAAVVAKRVALSHGIASAERLALPRFNRAEREDRAENEWRKRQ